MKLRILVLLLCLLNLNSILAQADWQWYVKGNTIKNNNNYNSGVIDSHFKISGLNISPSSTPQKRKDIFVIFDGGTCNNSRPTGYINNTSDLNFSPSIKVEYLYLTNIYQEDEPPSNTSINLSGTSGSSITPISTPFSVTHDFKLGDDVTVVIPDSTIKNCSMNPSLPVNLTYDQNIFTLENIFPTGRDWSYCNEGQGVASPGRIEGITPPKLNGIPKPYHYFNFKVIKDLPPKYSLGQTLSFDIQKSDGSVCRSITEPLVDMHDPNYIEVKCIYIKKKPWYCPFSSDQYYVKYYLQFYNDGNLPVPKVFVKLKFPSDLDPNNVKIGKWSFGGSPGCSTCKCFEYTYDNANNESTFSFSNNDVDCPSNLAAQSGPLTNPANPDPSQIGWVEFCVRAKIDPRNINLKPDFPKTEFSSTHIYSIDNFKDICINIEGKGDCIRTFSSYSVCNCNCSKTGDPKPILLPTK